MAKKKKPVETWPVSVIPAQYEVGSWSGQPHFKCLLCQADAFSAAGIHEHLVSAHNSEEALELVVSAEGVQQRPAPEPASQPGDSHVVAVFEMTDEEVQNLLNEGDHDGTNDSN